MLALSPGVVSEATAEEELGASSGCAAVVFDTRLECRKPLAFAVSYGV
jgi:hypothetical protein